MTQTRQLSREEIYHYHENGYLGPFVLCSPDEMSPIRDRIVDEVLPTIGRGGNNVQSRHLDSRLVYDLCAHPAVVERMASILGPDLILWRSNFFIKPPAGGREIPWHQDANYWPIEPPVNITAWIAIDHVSVENSCMQFIPSSHKQVVPHIKAGPEMEFQEMADPAFIDTSQGVNIELEAGEFILFNERLVHHSDPNRSDKRRIGLAARVTVPFVVVEHERLFERHKVMVINGEDCLGLNQSMDVSMIGK
ncbi:phytanoyl-CoA dioxygenase family protein [Chloroflexi bacterium TSY]|nr:phytanoyl-CoA dioxygenase family protein [Chloroflexi bacterium TSY]